MVNNRDYPDDFICRNLSVLAKEYICFDGEWLSDDLEICSPDATIIDIYII